MLKNKTELIKYSNIHQITIGEINLKQNINILKSLLLDELILYKLLIYMEIEGISCVNISSLPLNLKEESYYFFENNITKFEIISKLKQYYQKINIYLTENFPNKNVSRLINDICEKGNFQFYSFIDNLNYKSNEDIWKMRFLNKLIGLNQKIIHLKNEQRSFTVLFKLLNKLIIECNDEKVRKELIKNTYLLIFVNPCLEPELLNFNFNLSNLQDINLEKYTEVGDVREIEEEISEGIKIFYKYISMRKDSFVNKRELLIANNLMEKAIFKSLLSLLSFEKINLMNNELLKELILDKKPFLEDGTIYFPKDNQFIIKGIDFNRQKVKGLRKLTPLVQYKQ